MEGKSADRQGKKAGKSSGARRHEDARPVVKSLAVRGSRREEDWCLGLGSVAGAGSLGGWIEGSHVKFRHWSINNGAADARCCWGDAQRVCVAHQPRVAQAPLSFSAVVTRLSSWQLPTTAQQPTDRQLGGAVFRLTLMRGNPMVVKKRAQGLGFQEQPNQTRLLTRPRNTPTWTHQDVEFYWNFILFYF